MNNNKPLIGEAELDWISRYIHNPSPTGHEKHGQKLWLDYIRNHVDDYSVDVYGNVTAIVNPGKDFKVVVEAHADEIAWYVKLIDDKGFIHVAETGGTDPGIAPSQWVNIHTSKGNVPAAFGWPAIHTREVAQDAPKQSSIFLCCGCESREEAEQLGIQVGDMVTYQSGFQILNGTHYAGRALDNRMGGFMIARLAQVLREDGIELPFSLCFVNAVQEEVGTKGAAMVAESLRPSCAIVIDVTHDTQSPMMDKVKEGDIGLGRGPVITKAPPIHDVMRRLLLEAAKDNDIPFQLAAMPKETGTDADAFAYQQGGIPTALISMPLRYMHTTVETMHQHDIENTIRLLYYALQRITPDMDFKYL